MIFTVFASLHRGFHRSAQLIYISTSLSVCQALFSFSFKNVFSAQPEDFVFFRFSRSSLHIIQPKTPFVNYFFQFFSTFSSFVNPSILATISCGFSSTCIQDLGHFYRTMFTNWAYCRNASLSSSKPGRFRFITVQIPTPAKSNSLTKSILACQLRTSSNQTTWRTSFSVY